MRPPCRADNRDGSCSLLTRHAERFFQVCLVLVGGREELGIGKSRAGFVQTRRVEITADNVRRHAEKRCLVDRAVGCNEQVMGGSESVQERPRRRVAVGEDEDFHEATAPNRN